jgi:type IV pilus assembly protein PilM
MDFKTFIGSLMGTLEKESLVAVDIGASKIKALVLDLSGEKPRVVAAGMTPTPANALKNNQVANASALGNAIRSLLDSNDIGLSKVVFSIPGPNVFTKRVTTGQVSAKELDSTIRFEAGNYIPHNINDVYLDYQVIKTNSNSTMDVLLVAVKNDVVDGFVNVMQEAGLTPGIADVDFLRLRICFR